MAPLKQADVRNGLLRALAPDDFALLAPHLEPMHTQLRENLIIPNQPVTECFFPESGFVSVVALHDGREIEVGLIGREGVVGAIPILLEDDRTAQIHYVQMSGTVLGIATPFLQAAVEQSRTLRRLLLRYVHVFVVQVAQTAYAQGALGLESRLARWLLMVHDRVDGDELFLTHEFLSIMLGVQRASVTLALQNLEGAGRIKGRRKRIAILDRKLLEELANGVYGTPEAEYKRLIGFA